MHMRGAQPLGFWELLSTQPNAFFRTTQVPFRHKPTRKTIHLVKDLMEVFAKSA